MRFEVRPILIGLLIGVLIFPTVAVGGSFTISLIQGKTVEEAVQILAAQIDSLIGRVETVETKQVQLEIGQIKQKEKVQELQRELVEGQENLDRERSCRKAEELFKEAEIVYSSGSHRIISASAIDEFISATEKMLQEYKWLAKDQELLCPPTEEGIRAYCTTGNDHIAYHNHIYDYSLPQRERDSGAHDTLLLCIVDPSNPSRNWQNNIDRMLRSLKVEEETGEPRNKCDLWDFDEEVIEQQNKLEQLKRLNTEYIIQKEICEGKSERNGE